MRQRHAATALRQVSAVEPPHPLEVRLQRRQSRRARAAVGRVPRDTGRAARTAPASGCSR